ncbi:MAG: hypothetical protein Q7K39_01950 [Candidatus Magasanikbacteria bacterium]|nr:hypothetical protein [Candidatus Magasanikbacteria bacterium]
MIDENRGRSEAAATELARLTGLVVSGKILKERDVLAADPRLWRLVYNIYLELISFEEFAEHPAKEKILACGKMLAEIEDPEPTNPSIKIPAKS